MSLQEQITADLKTAMKERDRERTSSLRMVIAALKNLAVEEGLGPQGELSDDQVQKVLATEVKRRREAAEAFRDAGREEQAAKEEREVEIYEAYLPEQLSDEELGELLDAVIDEVGATGPQDMGKVMKTAMGRVQGRAEGARVSALVKERLAALG